MTFGMDGKTRMVWLLSGKKIVDTITRFDRLYERDRQTDGQTPHDGIGRACIASRSKKVALEVYYTVETNY